MAVPYLDNTTHPDNFVVLIGFGPLAVQAPDADQYRDEAWMRACFTSIWEMLAPLHTVRCVTHCDIKRFGKDLLPGEYFRVNVVPDFNWVPPDEHGNKPAGYTPRPLDRWMDWWQTLECFVSASKSGSVPNNVIHEMGHVIFSSKGAEKNPMHTDRAGTVFLAPPPSNATIDVPLTTELWREQLWYYSNGYRLNDQGEQIKIPDPIQADSRHH